MPSLLENVHQFHQMLHYGNLYNLFNANLLITRGMSFEENFEKMIETCNLSFNTWYGRVCEVAKQNNIEIEGNCTKRAIKLAVREAFKMYWHSMWIM